MRIDKNKLDEISKMNDRDMWEEIRKVASEKGFSLPKATPSKDVINKIRGALSGEVKISPSSALNILKKYKSGGN